MAKFDPKNKDDVAQLSRAVGYSRKASKVFRDNRLELMREYVGFNYSDNGSEDKVPVNLLELSMNIYLQRLVAQNPAVAVSTHYTKLKEIATRYELAGNHLIEEIKLGKTLETAVTAAMFCKGIVKIGLNRSKVEVGGVYHDSGQPFTETVSMDDWIQDMTSDCDEDSQYEGNYWYPTIDEAQELFPNHNWDESTSQVIRQHDKDHQISENNTTVTREEFRPRVRLLDLYLKKQNLILQCTTNDSHGDEDFDPIDKVLKSFEWNGPEGGPYKKLGFASIEGNTMPVAPAMHWKDLHELTNNLFRKLGRQAERQKTVLAVAPGGDDDGKIIVNANDGDTIKVRDPRNAQEFSTGGIDQSSLAFMMVIKDLYSYLAGNLDVLGGLGAQSETLGQDQLLSASASMRIQRMQKLVTEFTTEVIEDLMWYLWYDPNPKQPDVVKTLPGFESVAITVPFNPDDREGDYVQYNIKMEPYSMQHHSPESKMQGIRTILLEMVQPLLPMMEMQGITLDIEGLFRTVSKLSNIPEISDIIKFTEPSSMDEPVGASKEVAATKAPVTTRTSIRRNVSNGGTDQGRAKVLEGALLGQKSQPSEVSKLTG